jgi:hypothetical protein
MSHQFSRRALHELVWSEPRTALAKRLGVSDVGLAKACAKASIPMPPRGYWARLAAGKSATKASLRPRAFGQSDNVQVGSPDHRLLWGEEPPISAEPCFDEPLESVRARAETLLIRFKVPKGLQNPHQLIAEVLEEDAARRKTLETSPLAWRKRQFDSPSALRQLCIVNALVLAMAHAGCPASARSENLHKVAFRVGDTCIEVEIEFSRAMARTRVGARQTADQRMKLKATGWPRVSGVPCEWSDSDTQPLETRIAEIARDLLVMGEVTYRTAAHEQYESHVKRKRQLEAEAHEARARIEREENERRMRKEAAERDALLRQAANWRHASEIRALVNALDAKYQDATEVQDGKAYANWRAWALAQANLLDPCLQPLPVVITS